MTVNYGKSACTVWVNSSEKNTYKQDKTYKSAVETARNNGLPIFTYIGGDAPLLNGFSRLIDKNGASDR